MVGETVEPKTETYPPEGVVEKEQPAVIPSESAIPHEKDMDEDEIPAHLTGEGEKSLRDIPTPPAHRIQVPRLRGGKMSDDLE